jgi:hypothetical protein
VHFGLVVLGVIAAGSSLGEAFNELRDEQSGVVLRAAAARKHLDDDEPEQAIELTRQALAVAHVETNRVAPYETLAWAAISRRDPFIAHSALVHRHGAAASARPSAEPSAGRPPSESPSTLRVPAPFGARSIVHRKRWPTRAFGAGTNRATTRWCYGAKAARSGPRAP